MNKRLYKALGLIPVVGPILQLKNNFFAMKCSAFMADFKKTDDYKAMVDWMQKHPDQTLSQKMAEKIMKRK